jgi:hypothetical protein
MAREKCNSTVKKKEDECHDEDHEIFEWVFRELDGPLLEPSPSGVYNSTSATTRMA